MGDKFMPEMHLKQPGLFTYTACGAKKEQQNLKKQEIGDIFNKTN